MDEFEPVYPGECLFNKGVCCTDKDCEGCGWNPDVEEARKKKTREELWERS